jgi:hypothetical protein
MDNHNLVTQDLPVVVSTSQLEEGALLSCDAERHSWSGMTTIVLAP